MPDDRPYYTIRVSIHRVDRYGDLIRGSHAQVDMEYATKELGDLEDLMIELRDCADNDINDRVQDDTAVCQRNML